MENILCRLIFILHLTLVAQMLCFSLPIFHPRLGRSFKSRSASKRLSALRKRNLGPNGQFRVHAQPTNMRIIRLCSRNQNVFLQVHPNGVVNGTHDANSRYTNLIQESLGVSIVRLKGYSSKWYIAMNKQGRIYSTLIPNEDCLFNTNQEENYYHTFWSHKHKRGPRGWLLSVKKNGKMKRGSRTDVGEKSTQFVVLQPNTNL